MKKGYLFLIVSFLITTSVFSQVGQWKRTRYEAIVGIGAGNFMGDLGGAASGSAFNKYVGDIDPQSTRPSFMLGMRYRLTSAMSLKFNLVYGRLQSDDANSGDPGRLARNLNFFTNIYEQSLFYEYSIIKESNSRKWSKRRKKKVRGFSTNLYAFLGVAGFYFNPKSEFEGKTYSLWELGTEGQHIQGSGKTPYSRYAFSIPYGIGLKVGINKKIDIGIEYGFRYAMTDYIDNTGGKEYFSNEALIADAIMKGKSEEEIRALAFLADNNKGGPTFTQAMLNEIESANPEHPYLVVYKEGDRVPMGTATYDTGSPGVKSGPARDIYMFMFLNVSYKLQTARNGLPKFK